MCTGRRPGNAKTMVTALRSVLQFLHVEGVLATSLIAAVPSAASWRLAPLPRGPEPGEVNRLLTACDRRTAALRPRLRMPPPTTTKPGPAGP
jgi:hypothetical protein